MKTSMNTRIGLSLVWTMLSVVALSWTPARGDDLNPPPYRGQPLSVHAHWLSDPSSGALALNQFSWVDDSDPSTYLHPLIPGVAPGFNNDYRFELPNFVDELPLKLLRLQLTWTGTTQPPLSLFSHGLDIGQVIPGVITYSSNPLVFTQPDGGYQYFDIEFRPNPDLEYVFVTVPADAVLSQVVIDTISVPEPATLALLAAGGLVLRRRSVHQ